MVCINMTMRAMGRSGREVLKCVPMATSVKATACAIDNPDINRGIGVDSLSIGAHYGVGGAAAFTPDLHLIYT
jgi:hypothetical protein